MLPENIIVGGHEIKTIKHSTRYDQRRADTDLWKNVINVTTDQVSSPMQEQSYCHELIHQMLHKTGANILLDKYDAANTGDLSLEELLCCTLENVFWRMLKENTNLFESPYTDPALNHSGQQRPISSENLQND